MLSAIPIGAQGHESFTNSPLYRPGELLVKFRGGPRGEAAGRVQKLLRHSVKRDFAKVGWQHIKLPSGLSVQAALGRYQKDPGVLAAEPNYFVKDEGDLSSSPATRGGGTGASVDAIESNDPLYPFQWNLAKIRAASAWAVSTGSPEAVLAVMDRGIDYTHQDLAENLWRNPFEIPGNGVDEDQNGYIDDFHGADIIYHDGDPMIEVADGNYHGTACASVMGASGNNGHGISGLNWRTSLMAIRVSNEHGFHAISTDIGGLEYILNAKQRGINVRAINMSFGTLPGVPPSLAERDGIEAAGEAGILVVASAGNRAQSLDANPAFPAAYDCPNIISVAASDAFDNLAQFSNWGSTNVHLSAPGVHIYAAWGPGQSDYRCVNGTSFAAPHVSGTVALLASIYPGATGAQLRAAILDSVDVIPSLKGKVLTGGRLNVGRAVQYILNVCPRQKPVIVSPARSQTVGVGGPLQLEAGAGGSALLCYQWYQGALALEGRTNALLAITNASRNSAGDYRVVVSNLFGCVTNGLFVVSVTEAPLLARSPANATTFPGGTAVLQAEAAGDPAALRYQWFQGDVPIAGATNSLLMWSNTWVKQCGIGVEVDNGRGRTKSDTVCVEPAPIAAWGDNQYGQCNVPPGLAGVVSVAGGAYHSLALGGNGSVWAWGCNEDGQARVPAGFYDVKAIAAGCYSSLALRSNGTVIGWGGSAYGELNVPTDATALRAVAAGPFHYLALKSNGTVLAWGDNRENQATVPRDLVNVKAIAAGLSHNLALLSNGTIRAWGNNALGQCEIPENLADVMAVAAGGNVSLALKEDKTVAAWGSNANGQLDIPAGATNVAAIAGAAHFLALKTDGTVVAWGADGTEGGAGFERGPSSVPANLPQVRAIAAGGRHSLGLVRMPDSLVPKLTQPLLKQGGFAVRVATEGGKCYTLETANTLHDADWWPVDMLEGDGQTRWLNDPNGLARLKFYRVEVW